MSIELTKDEQLVGLLSGVWSADADAAFRTNGHRALLTVTRVELLEYLRGNSQAARDYLNKWEKIRPATDINLIWAEADGYKVAWISRDGKPSSIRVFRDLNDAIAEHVCRHNGIQA